MLLITARFRTLLSASTEGLLISAMFTHNPLIHLIPILSPFALLTAPVLGGMAARGRTRIGPFGALFVALCVTAINTLPFDLVLPFLIYYKDKFGDPARAEMMVNGYAVFIAAWASYTFLGVLLGITLRNFKPMISTPAWLMQTRVHSVFVTPERLAVASDTRVAIGRISDLLTVEVDARTLRPHLN